MFKSLLKTVASLDVSQNQTPRYDFIRFHLHLASSERLREPEKKSVLVFPVLNANLGGTHSSPESGSKAAKAVSKKKNPLVSSCFWITCEKQFSWLANST